MDLARLGFRVDTGDLSRARGEVDKLSGAFKSLATLVGVGLSLDKTIRTIMDFEDSMLSLQATSKATADEMARLEKQARSLGATTRYSAKEAADAQNFLAMAGFNTSKILAATGDVINFASAANLGLAQSASIASGTLAQMGLGVESLTDVMDAMVNVSQSADTDVAQIAEAMKYAGRTAASVGLDIAETAAVIGVLGDNSLVGSQAGTSLLGVFRQLLVVTPQNEKVLAGYNLTVKDLDITTRGLIPVMRDLQAAQVDPKDYMMLFGEAANAAMAIAESTDRIVEMTVANRSLSGATKETASIMDSGLSAALAAVNSASEEAMIQLGEGKNGLGGALKTLAVTTAGVINVFNGFSDEFNESNGVSVEFAKNIELIAEGVKVLGGLIIAKLVGSLISSAAAFVLAQAQAVRYMYLVARVATTTRAAAAQITLMNLAMNTGAKAMALLGGPAGIAMIAAGALFYFGSESSRAEKKIVGMRTEVDNLSRSFDGMSKNQAKAAMITTMELIDQLAEKHKKLTEKMITWQQNMGSMAGGMGDWDAHAKSMDKARGALDDLTGEMAGLIDKTGQLQAIIDGKPLEKLAADAADAGGEFKNLAAPINSVVDALQQQYIKLKLGEKSYSQYKAALDGASAAEVKQIGYLHDGIKAMQEKAEATKKAAEKEKALKKETEDFVNSVKSAIDPLHDIEKAMTKAWAAHAKGLLSDKEVAEYVKTFTTGSEKIDKKIKETTSLTDEAAKRIDAAFADAWANIDDGFGGLINGIKNSFRTMLAEMAHEALTRPILLNIQQGAGSLFGAADAATKTTSDAAGGAVGAGGASVMAGAIAAGALVTVAAINSHNKKDDERMMKYTAEYRQGQQSTGTVLGDIDAKSHSLSNLTESLVEMGTDSLDVNHGMLRSLQAIESGIKGVSQGIARQLSSAGGLQDFESTTSTSTIVDKILGIAKFELNPFGSALDKIGLGFVLDKIDLGFVDDFLDGLIGGISKAVYSKKKTLQDAGIDFANQSLGAIIDSGFVEADAYQQIKTTRKTLGIKKSSSSKEVSDLDDAIQYQLGSIFSKAAGVLGDVGAELAIDFTDNFIRNLEIDAGELSLKDLKGDELSAEIESFISSNLDGWAESMLKAADMEGVAAQYQQAGEGVFETLGRLVAQSKNLQQTAERLNLQFNASGLEAAELTQKLAGMAGGFSNLQALTGAYYQEYFSGAEKQADLQRDLTRAFAEHNTELPKSKEAFRALVESVDLTTKSGQQAYVALMNVQAPFAQYVDALEKAAEMSRKFNESINQQIESFGLAGQALDNFNLNKWLDETKKEAEIAGGDMIAVEKLYWLKRTEISEKYALEAAQAAQDLINADQEHRLGLVTNYLQNLANWSAEELNRIEADYRERIALAEQQMRIGRELRQYVEQLRISELSPYDPGKKLELASESFAKLLVRAEAGDLEAAALLQQAANSYLQNADSYYGRSDAYVSIFDDVTKALDDLGISMTDGEDAIEKLNQQMLAEQQRIRDYAREQLSWVVSQHAELTSINHLLSLLPDSLAKQLAALSAPATPAETAPARESTVDLIKAQYENIGGGIYSQNDLERFAGQVDSGDVSLDKINQELEYYKNNYSKTMQQVLDLWNSSGGGDYGQAELDRYVKGVVDTGGSVSIDDLNWYRNTMDGSHANGLESVPFDGYRAELHQNEMVLPASVADHIRTSMSSGNTTVQQDNRELVAEIKSLKEEVVQLRTEQERANYTAEQQRNNQVDATEDAARASRQTVEVM